MTNCCNAYGECEHGTGCPMGVDTVQPEPKPVPRSCEALGVCQHPERECPGACEQKPKLHAWEPADPGAPVQGFTVEGYGRDNIATALLVAALGGATLGIVYGATRWAWQTWGVLA